MDVPRHLRPDIAIGPTNVFDRSLPIGRQQHPFGAASVGTTRQPHENGISNLAADQCLGICGEFVQLSPAAARLSRESDAR